MRAFLSVFVRVSRESCLPVQPRWPRSQSRLKRNVGGEHWPARVLASKGRKNLRTYRWRSWSRDSTSGCGRCCGTLATYGVVLARYAQLACALSSPLLPETCSHIEQHTHCTWKTHSSSAFVGPDHLPRQSKQGVARGHTRRVRHERRIVKAARGR